MKLTHSLDPDHTVALKVNRITLRAFRNYQSARLETHGQPVVITGPNGAGKTNLLEAISLLVPGRGMRGAKLSDLDRKPGDEAWAVAADIEARLGPQHIGTGRDPLGEKRLIQIDGTPAKSQTDLADHLSVVWLTPQMDRLFQGNAAERRRFLDRLVFGYDPAHAGRLSSYDKAMRQRARLLKDRIDDARWLRSLEAQMVERGSAIAAARQQMAERVNAMCEQPVGPFPGARLVLTGAIEMGLSQQPALEVEMRFSQELEKARARDALIGGASVGPHRSDLDVFHLVKQREARSCSTGEQKALLIALLLGGLRVQAAEKAGLPLLLLDEVGAHLDEEKKQALFATLDALGVQYWLTGTEKAVFTGLLGQASWFHVENAHITLP